MEIHTGKTQDHMLYALKSSVLRNLGSHKEFQERDTKNQMEGPIHIVRLLKWHSCSAPFNSIPAQFKTIPPRVEMQRISWFLSESVEN